MTWTVSRRSLIRTAAAATGASLFVGSAAAKAAPGEAMTAYHGVTGAVHQQKFNELSAAGYRMISISVYGDRADPRYAAVWLKRGGPAWAALHGLDSNGYQTRFNQLTGQGFVPVLVSATGPRNNPVFAAVFEKISAPTWIARHGLVDGPAGNEGTLSNVNRWARDHNCIPKTIAIYGGAGQRTYAGVWLPNPGDVKWQAHDMGNGNQYQGWFNAYTAAGLRPTFVDSSEADQYLAIFTDDSVGPWVARHGIDSAQYQQEFDKQVAASRYPISVQGGSNGRYSAVFAGRDLPIGRTFTQANAAGATFTGVHEVMREFMQARGVRAGQLAVRRNGTLRLSAGYTWAEPGYAQTEPTSLMRVASVSKAFACAAIRRLDQDDKLDLDAEVFPLLGITTKALASQTKDNRVDDITVRQCVAHTGGWVRSVSKVDPVFYTRQIARALNLPGRATKRDVARYMYGEPLQYKPGDSGAYDGSDRYSNFGYVLLGLVVEQVSKMSFRNYLAHEGLIDGQTLVGGTQRGDRRPDEVSYDHAEVGNSAVDPWSDARVPVAYGNFLVEAMDSGGGLITTAPAVTSLISTNAVWGLGGRAPNSARTGSMPGCYSRAESRNDGIDWCYIINTNTIRDADSTLNQLAKDLNAAITAAGV